MSNKEILPGDQVKVRGCYYDFTDLLDGCTVTVLATDGTEAIVLDENGSVWIVYVENLLPEKEVSI